MERPKDSTIAWGVLLAGVAAYEVRCKQGETLSEGLDPCLERGGWRRALLLGALAYTAAHLGNLLPEGIDGFHQLGKLKK